MNHWLKIQFLVTAVFAFALAAEAQLVEADTLPLPEAGANMAYPVTEQRAERNIFTKYFYRYLFSPSIEYSDREEFSLHYYRQMQGKKILNISINAIDVFGPTVEDTTRKAKNWIERAANSIHITSNLNTIQRMLMFNTGDTVSAELMYENERIIRSLPYISDVRISLEQDTVNADGVNVHIITKDRFSFGVSGGINGTSSGNAELYNKNIFGVGHEISLRFVGNINRQPYMGLETFYSINNIRGKFINISAGYMNTYLREGFSFVMSKPFITPLIKWGYGGSVIRMYRTNRIYDTDHITTDSPFSLSLINAWGGRSFQINQSRGNSSQIVVAAGVYNRTFLQLPEMSFSDHKYFSNSTFFLAGLTFTQRRYIQDQLVYSYGITEDIPKGFKNEFVYGYDVNEFGNRHYFHLSLSNGNILINRDGYMYLTGGIGGYFRDGEFFQGQIQGSANYISRQINAGRKTFRLFLKSHYMLGINRFEIENLNLGLNNEIRGFTSSQATGKQKLSVDLEYVLFLRKEKLKFNLALFSFANVGIIGSNTELIFTQNYYSGFGLGMRLHNENLVLKTIQLRLAFYPFHPGDMGFMGFILNEQLKNNFYSFEPQAPQPLIFQ